MVGKLEISSFHPNFNRNKRQRVAPDSFKTIHGGLV
jgi:hypothetical protein